MRAPPSERSTTVTCSMSDWQPVSPEYGHAIGTGTYVTMYSSVPLLNTCGPTPGTVMSGTWPASVVSSACAIGSTRTSDVVLSLPHQSLDTSPIVAPTGCAV